MYKIYLTIIIAFFAINVQSQTMKPDTIVMGAGYTNDVFYNVFNGTKTSTNNTDWHLAFMAKNRTATIRINSGRGVRLYRVPNADISAFATFDTTGWRNFPELHDMNMDWERDAFTSTAPGPSSPFDYGWGNYDQNSHHVLGDSLYIVELPGGVIKRLAIDSLLYDSVYTFRYANIDNTDLKYGTINKANYRSKLFVYYALTSDATMDKEPVDSTWQLKFTRYNDLVPSGPSTFSWYPVVGALSNRATEVVKAMHVDINSPRNPNDIFRREMNIIGSDWKIFDQGNNQWNVSDSLVYFVRMNRKNTADSIAIAKIVFTGFGGATDGKIIMNTGATTIGVSEISNALTSLGIYPNPATSNANILFNSNSIDSKGRMNIFAINGQQIQSEVISVKEGINNIPLSISGLTSGLYIIKIETTSGSASFKLSVNE